MAAAELFGVGDELRKARRLAGLKQAELAKIAGVSRATVSNWENGIGEPTVSQWRRIAKALDADWLLSGQLSSYLESPSDQDFSVRQMRLRLFEERVLADRRRDNTPIAETRELCLAS